MICRDWKPNAIAMVISSQAQRWEGSETIPQGSRLIEILIETPSIHIVMDDDIVHPGTKVLDNV